MDSEVTEFENPTVCPECFSLVADLVKHDEWHQANRRHGDLRNHVPEGTVVIDLVDADGNPRE